MNIKVVCHKKGDPRWSLDQQDTYPDYSLGIKWCINPRKQWWGAYGIYSRKNQYTKAWYLLLIGIIANARSLRLCEWAEPDALFSI